MDYIYTYMHMKARRVKKNQKGGKMPLAGSGHKGRFMKHMPFYFLIPPACRWLIGDLLGAYRLSPTTHHKYTTKLPSVYWAIANFLVGMGGW